MCSRPEEVKKWAATSNDKKTMEKSGRAGVGKRKREKNLKTKHYCLLQHIV